MPLDALGKLVRQLERQPRWRGQQQFRQVLDSWSEVVGEGVDRQTVPVRIDKRQVLYVAVSSPTWAQTLSFERLRILEKLNAQVQPPLQDIRFSTGDWYRRPNPRRSAYQPDLEVLQAHPSFVPLSDDFTSAPLPLPQTANDAFQQWAERIRAQANQQPLCPVCQCPCPPGELQRWAMCSLCVTKTSSSRGIGS